jgi:hypothetical protein
MDDEWVSLPNLAMCFWQDPRAYTQDDKQGWVTQLFNSYVERRLVSLLQLRYRWYLARGSKVFARINASEINRILQLERQRNFLESGLSPKVAWELTPLSFIVDWFTNSAAIATSVTDIWQSMSENVHFTDQGLWAVLRSEAYGSLVAPDTIDVVSLRVFGGCSMRIRVPDEHGWQEIDGSRTEQFDPSVRSLRAMQQGRLIYMPLQPNTQFDNTHEKPFVDSQAESVTCTLDASCCGTAHAVIRAYYAKRNVESAQRVALVTTRLPIEVQAWRALLPRLEFHMTDSKFTSLLALIAQGIH